MSTAEFVRRLAAAASRRARRQCGTSAELKPEDVGALGATSWGNAATIALALLLAFFFGYAFTMVPLLRAGMALGPVIKVALAADTISITIMEVVDNAIMIVIPGAMDAGLDSLLFWSSLAVALLIAGAAAFPVNRWLIARGYGHALVHNH
jgi:hypothetical protein